MPLSSGQKKALVGLVGIAFLLRFALLLAFQGYRVDQDWKFGYESGSVARALAAGEGLSSPFEASSILDSPASTGPTAWLMPVFPGILAGLFKYFGSYSTAAAFSILTINSIVSAVTCLGVFFVGMRVFGAATAWLASTTFAVYPPSIWHSITTIWDTTLFACLVVFSLWGFLVLQARFSLRRTALYGLWTGGVALVNALILAFAPFVVLWLLLASGRRKAGRVGAAALFSVCVVAVLSPWLLRNHAHFGSFFLRSNLGVELRLGNSEFAWQDYLQGMHTDAPLMAHPAVVQEEFDRFVALGEGPYGRWAMAEAVNFIFEHPMRFVKMSARRVQFFWLSDLTVDNAWTGNLNVPWPSVVLSVARKVSHLLPLPFMVIGIAAALRERRPVGALLAMLILFPIIYYVTHVTQRYRFPIESVILLFASYGLVVLHQLWRSRPGWRG